MRPSSFRSGTGGFLSGVDSTLEGYQFVVGAPAEIKKGDRKGEIFTPLSLVPSFLVDGAADPVSQRLLIGDAANYGEVSADGLTLTIGEGRINVSSEAAIFVNSLVEAGFPAENFDEDDTTWNIEPAIGTRLRTEQVINVEKTKRQGMQVGKNGRSYDRKDLTVSKVYAVPRPQPPGKNKPVAGATGKTGASAAKGKAAKAVDVAEEASEALRAVVAAKGGVIAKPKLRMALLTALTGKSANRDAIIAWAQKDENLDTVEGLEYDEESISVAA